MSDKILELLYRSFDTELTQKEQQELKQALENSEELRQKKQQIEGIRAMVSGSTQRAFKPFFSARVMNRINVKREGREDFFSSLLWSFRLVGTVAAVTLLALLTNNAIKSQSLSVQDILAMPHPTLEETLELEILQPEEQ